MVGIIGGALRGSRFMEIVKKHDSGGLLWKRIKLTPTRKHNAIKRLRRVWQNEAVLKACSGPAPSRSDDLNDSVAHEGDTKQDPGTEQMNA